MSEIIGEATFLLRVLQSESCPDWVEGVGDCHRVECKFCRVEKCLNDLENKYG